MAPVKNLLWTIFILIAVAKCSLFDSGGETIKGHYNIGWIDTKSNRSINYALENEGQGGIEKIGAFIKRMGHNNRFIIVERFYYDAFLRMNKPNSDSTSFYIIDMDKESPYKNDDVLGPFTKAEFKRKKIELEIEDLEFTEEYNDY